MKGMSLLQRVKESLTLNLLFSASFATKKDQEGKVIAILKLVDPLEEVRGSQEVEFNGERFPLIANDVTEVSVHESNMSESFESNDDGTITYKGDDLILDVAKTNKGVWLVKESYASAGNKLRQNGRSERIGKLLGMDAMNPAANAAPGAKTPITVAPTVVNPAKEKVGP